MLLTTAEIGFLQVVKGDRRHMSMSMKMVQFMRYMKIGEQKYVEGAFLTNHLEYIAVIFQLMLSIICLVYSQ